eukprot:CAMPEP_0202891678 /NCGR_PEP_ID=MMETSP1392-20130828/1679_1 /ASSEMBLY_ACC=CAM_ASM_000868 /TAXON_ID=225041 /ORGANISM="Chlamydomonas chlamydogama, Strain SAG 11-48b" /LENGTH=532 /DNA_ID=CAMNT_0049575503 /DNA_START=91 /DNA_END=1690 /DNA_ORIENTATION=+
MPAACAPLQAAGANDLLRRNDKPAEWNGQKSAATFHVFINQTKEPVDLYWFYDGGQNKHGTIQPGSNVYVGSYTFHQWKVLSQSGRFLGLHAGGSATVTVTNNGCSIQYNAFTGNGEEDPHQQGHMETANGTYLKRGEALGIAIWAFECVEEAAVRRAEYVVQRMLECSPPSIRERMVAAGAVIGVLGRNQVVTDLPPHSFMKYNAGRNLDKTSRGLGATSAIPVTSVGEENLMMDNDPLYPCQSILVHEFGHAVLNLAMTPDQHERLCAAYNAALVSGHYSPDIYMMENEQEYFATGVEAWFESTIRTDVNGGINTREKLQAQDPGLAVLVQETFGNGEWRYVHDCPHPLRMPGRRPKVLSQPGQEASMSRAAQTSSGGSSTSQSSTYTAGCLAGASNAAQAARQMCWPILSAVTVSMEPIEPVRPSKTVKTSADGQAPTSPSSSLDHSSYPPGTIPVSRPLGASSDSGSSSSGESGEAQSSAAACAAAAPAVASAAVADPGGMEHPGSSMCGDQVLGERPAEAAVCLGMQ